VPVDARIRIRSAEPADAGPIRACLAEAELGFDDIGEHLANFLVAEKDGRVIGTVGMEVYGASGLLRSAAVLPAERSGGIGRSLVDALERRARGAGIRELVLLTTTAEGYFTRQGYRVVNRGDVSGRILASGQFQGSCPATAVVMRKNLGASL
jgi:amino-acid N-acetyltransferase